MPRAKKKAAPKKRPLKLPKSVTLGAHTIPIKLQKNLMDSEAFGVFDPNKLEILIDESISENLMIETVMHEVVEAINFLVEADMPHQTIQLMGLMLHQAMESMFSISKICR
jgi:hypothetical protein|tara:strand:- start:6981 stop:7313 length:333 start_codon:yes stop_codon:yes gene_type:complete